MSKFLKNIIIGVYVKKKHILSVLFCCCKGQINLIFDSYVSDEIQGCTEDEINEIPVVEFCSENNELLHKECTVC
jgi:hypothetical protein